MEVGVLVGWVLRSSEPRIFTKCRHVCKGKAGLLAKGQASVARYGRAMAVLMTHAIHATLLQQLAHPKALLPDLENYSVGNSFFPQKLFILNQKYFHSGL